MLVLSEKIQHTLATLLTHQTEDQEQIFIINNVPWEVYESLVEDEESSGFRLTYLQGTLEIMSPGRRHEFTKTNIALLLETYFVETRTRFYGLGSTTLRNELTSRGLEPDECYCLYSDKSIPDLAIEVIVTSGGLNSLEVYQGLGVPEVWFWRDGKFFVYLLRESQYINVTQSELLPNLDLELLASFVSSSEPLEAALEFRKTIK